MADLNVGQLGLLLAVTLASAVEFVEAFTIVLAMGITRDWRSTLAGTALALVALAAVTLFAGYALIEWFPEALLQLVIGTLLLIFGLQWLRKAILRAAGLKAQHDEDAIFHEEAAAARGARRESVMGLDWFAFVVSFKGVFLEGLEVVFIVLTFGLSAGNVPLAVAGAAVAGTTRPRRGRPAPSSAVARPGEHHQVRRRDPALDVRDLLGGRGSGRVRSGRAEPGVARR